MSLGEGGLRVSQSRRDGTVSAALKARERQRRVALQQGMPLTRTRSFPFVPEPASLGLTSPRKPPFYSNDVLWIQSLLVWVRMCT
jgi:hypothetical protein